MADYILQFNRELLLLLLTTGKIVTEDVIVAGYDAVERFIAIEARSGPYRGIWDFSAAESFDVSPDFIRRLAIRPPAIPPGTLRVVVAPRPDVYGLSRMFQLLRDGMKGEFKVERTLEEAYDLLEISAAPPFTMVNETGVARTGE